MSKRLTLPRRSRLYIPLIGINLLTQEAYDLIQKNRPGLLSEDSWYRIRTIWRGHLYTARLKRQFRRWF